MPDRERGFLQTTRGLARANSIADQGPVAFGRDRCGDGNAAALRIDDRMPGGPSRNRTDIKGFAVLCIAILPSGRHARPARYRTPPRLGQGGGRLLAVAAGVYNRPARVLVPSQFGFAMPIDFVLARRNMVECQLRPNSIVHPGLLEALAGLPRERFLPEERAALAYVDEAIPLGGGRCLMEPMVLARLVQSAQPIETDRALVVGAGPGFGAAVLARLVKSVVALEADAALVQRARHLLPALGAANVKIVEGDLAGGCKADGPYDVILIEGSVPAIPDSLSQQLADGGRLVGVVGGGVPGYPGQAHLGRKTGGLFSSRPIFDAGTPPLPGFAVPSRFVF